MNFSRYLICILVLGVFMPVAKAMDLTTEIKVPMPKGRAAKEVRGVNLDIGPTRDDEQMTVTLLLRRANAKEFEHLVSDLKQQNTLARPMAPDQLANRYGADPTDVEIVIQFARDHHLQIVRNSPEMRTLVVSGEAKQFNAIFGIRLHSYKHPKRKVHSYKGTVQLPIEIASLIEGVVGLDNRLELTRTIHSRQATPVQPKDNAAGTAAPMFASATARFYNFPQGTGAGECIALVELGGGYTKSDMQAYFNLGPFPYPDLQDVSVDGGQNSPGVNPDQDGEVALDIQVPATVAPGARIVTYFAENGFEQGFLNAISTAVHDSKNHCSTLSISWGNWESHFSESFIQQTNQFFLDAAAQGMTVFLASGDDGYTDGEPDGLAAVDYPGSNPNVVDCGGTTLLTAPDHSLVSEVAWTPKTGGGISSAIAMPDYQKNLTAMDMNGGVSGLAGRGVPDVAGNADPESGYAVVFGGAGHIVGGTSGVAPLYAGLFAIINSNLGKRVGFINGILYAHPEAFHVITDGNNGGYQAVPSGWSAVTGLGSPDGKKLQAIFANQKN